MNNLCCKRRDICPKLQSLHSAGYELLPYVEGILCLWRQFSSTMKQLALWENQWSIILRYNRIKRRKGQFNYIFWKNDMTINEHCKGILREQEIETKCDSKKTLKGTRGPLQHTWTDDDERKSQYIKFTCKTWSYVRGKQGLPLPEKKPQSFFLHLNWTEYWTRIIQQKI
jgi:hypothetical protein